MSIINPLFGIGDVQRAALLQIFDGLNDTLDALAAHYEPDDETTALHLGRSYVPIAMEHVRSENFYEGHRPSLITAPVDNYPNCSVWCVRATPSAESALLDHSAVYNDILYVEVMARGINEDEVNIRLQRLAEAANLCMRRDQSLGGRVSGFGSDPVLNLSDVFKRRENTSYGEWWYWQGARLEYAVRKDAAIPSMANDQIFRASSPEYDIDQI